MNKEIQKKKERNLKKEKEERNANEKGMRKKMQKKKEKEMQKKKRKKCKRKENEERNAKENVNGAMQRLTKMKQNLQKKFIYCLKFAIIVAETCSVLKIDYLYIQREWI